MTGRTWSLAAVLAVLVGADVVARLEGSAPEPPPAIGTFRHDEPVALTLTGVDGPVRLVREDGWRLVTPFAHAADDTLVGDLLDGLGRGVPMDTRVDAGSHDRYGLDGADPVLVEVDGATGPLARFYVGRDAGDGSTFVRFPNDDTVWRARIGGRARYARPAGDWRDHRVLDLDAAHLVTLQVGDLRFVRDAGLGGPPGDWRLEDDPAFSADDALLDALATALAALRASEILSPQHPAGWTRGLALTRDDGSQIDLEIGRTPLGAFARTEAGAPVYRLPTKLVDLLLAERDAWRDRTLLRVDGLVAMTLEDDLGVAVVELDPRTQVWSLVRPAHVEADPRRIAQVAGALAQLRVDALVSASPAFTTRIRLTDTQGRPHLLEVGGFVPGRAEGMEQVYVRLAERPERVGVIAARSWSAIRAAWAR